MKLKKIKFLRSGNHPPLILIIISIIGIFVIIYVITFKQVDIESTKFWEETTIFVITALCLVGIAPAFYFYVKELMK